MRTPALCLTILLCTSFAGHAQLTHSISEIQGQQFTSPLVGSIVTTSGVVTANNVTSATSGVIGYFIQDGEGPWNGIFVYDQIQAPQIGDEIIIECEVAEFYDETELVNISYFETVSSGNDLPTPSIVTTGELASSEAYEGCLVQIVNAVCVNPDADYGEAIFDDGSGEVKTNDYMFWPEEGWIQDEYYSITGCIHYTFEEYKIEPRYSDDIVQVCNPTLDLDLGDWGYFPDPSLGQQFDTVLVGVPYSDVFTVVVPNNASATDPAFELPLDSIEILDIQVINEETGEAGLLGDIGIQTTCNNLNTSNSECTFLSGGQYCLTLEGIAAEPGTYSMTINLDAWVTVFGVGVAQPSAIQGYTLVVEGPCENDEACNYGEIGNCEFPIPPYDCSGNCVNDTDSDGICDEDEILGCTYEIACNYNPNATEDDDSCEFYCPGCTDLEACNYDEGAIQDDGTCLYPEDLYGSDVVDCSGNCLNDEDLDGVCDPNETLGCTNSLACNFIPEATDDDGTCEFISCSGCTYEYACNYAPEALYSDGSCVFGECSGCTDSSACNFNPTVADDDGSCTYAPVGYDCDGSCTLDENSDGICDVGCIDPSACNYNEQATIDDGSCQLPVDYYDCDGNCINDEDGDGYCDELEISGCTNSIACNFDPVATDDSGLCEYCCGAGTAWNGTSLSCEIITGFGDEVCGDGTYWDPVTQTCQTMDSCPEDLDGDGLVTVSDLLQLLGSFGEACEVSVVEFTCGNPLSYHGYDYATVQIGERCWFAENLKAQFYANGDEILGDLTSEQWSNTQSGAQTVYGGSIDFYELYGRLYNGYAVLDSRGLCPPAWNVPSDDEWKELEIVIGMSVIEADEIGWRGSDEGHKLKSNYGWSGLDGDGNGSDSFSFEGLPGGQAYASDGNTYGAPSSGIWWSSSLSAESTLWYRYLRYSNMRVLRDLDGTVNAGMSVRCVKGSE